jgi:hypothetical protein
MSTIISLSTPPVDSSVNVVPQSQLPSTIYGTESTPLVFNTNTMTTPSGPWTVPTTLSADGMTTLGPSLSHSLPWTVPTTAIAPSVTMPTFSATPSPSTAFSTDGMTTLGPSLSPYVPWTETMVPSDILQADGGESSTPRENEILNFNELLQTALLIVQSSGLYTVVERGPIRDMLTNDTRNLTNPLVQVWTI